MSTRLHVVENVKYNNEVLEWLRAYGNPIADNLENYISETLHYYISSKNIKDFEKYVVKDIKKVKDDEDKKMQYDTLERIKEYVKEKGEIEIEAW